LTLRPYLARRRGVFALCAAGLLASSVFGLLVPWTMRSAVDALSLPGGRVLLGRAVKWMALFAALHALFRYAARRGLLVAARRVEEELRGDLFARVIRLPMSFFAATPTGDIMSRLSNDTAAIWLLLGPGVLTLLGTLVSWTLAVGFMARISLPLTAAAAAVAPLVALSSWRYGRALHQRHRLVQEALASLSAAVQENVTGIRIVKAHGMERSEEERFGRLGLAYYRRSVSVSSTQAAFHGAIGLLSGVGAALVLGFGGWLVVRGDLSLGGFVAFSAYLAMLAFPTMALGWVINLFQRGAAAMGRLNGFLSEAPEPSPGEGAAAPTAAPGAARAPRARGGDLLRVRDLSFAWSGLGGRPVLRGVSFSVARGEAVALVGPTGAGKTTLFLSLLRLWPVPPGTVFFDGRDAVAWPLAELRRRIAFVPQEPFLFSDTIAANIAFGAPSADAEAVRRAARRAGLVPEIEEMPLGFQTVVGERGISLSGGQKQRVTLARALCAGGELLLLDDPFSAVDAQTEAAILDDLLAARDGRTILFTTHRLSALSRCDRILVLAGGRIVEEGTHETLLARRGAYRDLYLRRMLAKDLEEDAG